MGWVATCTNPACRAEVPLLKGFYLANTKTKQVYLKPIIRGTHIDFEIASGKCDQEGWMGSALICPCCGSLTDVKKIKEQSKNSLHSDSIELLSGNPYKMKERLLAVIVDGKNGKEYRIPTQEELDVAVIDKEKLRYDIIPHEKMKEIPDLVSGRGWGIDQWSQMFSNRQLIAMQTLVKKVKEVQGLLHKEEYANAIITYMGIIVSKYTDYNNKFTVWTPNAEQLSHTFSKQSLPMVFDYPESMPFIESGGSPYNMLGWVLRYIISESQNSFSTTTTNASSGDKSQFQPKFLTATITDPPYYDAIAYADLSDFFYVWLKRTVGEIYPDNFLTPQTPKSEECTALKHHYNNDKQKANIHFETKLKQIFLAIEHQTSEIISIMFAHQSTEAWTTLCNSIIGANMNITGSWAIDTERANRSLGLSGGAVLQSSVTVACRPIVRQALGDYKKVRKAIETTIQQQVKELYTLGFRGADLLTACFGLAVGEAGKYTHVEKTDGTEVTIAYLLEMTKEIAFNSLLKGFDGDDFTKFYIGWLQLYSFTETDFDDAAKFSRVGLSINVAELFSENILVKKGNRQTPATYTERIKADKNLGKNGSNCRILLDIVHKIMHLFEKGDRKELIEYIAKTASSQDSNVWRVLTALCEVLPKNSTDFQQASGLLAVKDNLIRASKETEERLL